MRVRRVLSFRHTRASAMWPHHFLNDSIDFRLRNSTVKTIFFFFNTGVNIMISFNGVDCDNIFDILILKKKTVSNFRDKIICLYIKAISFFFFFTKAVLNTCDVIGIWYFLLCMYCLRDSQFEFLSKSSSHRGDIKYSTAESFKRSFLPANF